jgi:hypothetical protein
MKGLMLGSIGCGPTVFAEPNQGANREPEELRRLIAVLSYITRK